MNEPQFIFLIIENLPIQSMIQLAILHERFLFSKDPAWGVSQCESWVLGVSHGVGDQNFTDDEDDDKDD